ncbi:DUF1643 domain-containing protein [Ruficoccus amylovorans]|uniref:DUF1643 domain-containing protein n=1 Tax=Ruficoccus amylovorans TaxID=1804625 RepID=A0A842HE94_9BACT|nr:DUF1643 domain-containing protein [Ruficoccus amylovorans]MBC2594895.1 DUF1643 domain-containing protein [Ruficoccus amylovorans]
MNNPCIFSPGRKYRYMLKHRWDELMPENTLLWIGLNPSTADENVLDPTLRRIKAFSVREGYSAFIMCNLFAFRATNPKDMLAQSDPVGPWNDGHILDFLAACRGKVVACWGTDGNHHNRAEIVMRLLRLHSAEILCLGRNLNKTPKHPLYVKGDAPLVPYKLGK